MLLKSEQTLSRKNRAVFFLMLLSIMIIFGCGGGTGDKKTGYTQTGDAVIVHGKDIDDMFTFAAEAEDTVSAAVRLKAARYDVSKSARELINLPLNWESVRLYKSKLETAEEIGKNEPQLIISRTGGQLDTIPTELTKGQNWFFHNILTLFGYGLIVLYLCSMFSSAQAQFSGDTGFALLVIQFVVMCVLIAQWERGLYILFIALLLIQFSLYLLARKIDKPDYKKPVVIIHLIGYILVSISIFVLVLIEKDYVSTAAWSTSRGISLYVQPHEREEIELVDSEKTVLKSFKLKPGIKLESLLFWPDGNTVPVKIRLLKNGTVVRELELGKRPDNN